MPTLALTYRQILEQLLQTNDRELDQPGMISVELPPAHPGAAPETVIVPVLAFLQTQEPLYATAAGICPASALTEPEREEPTTRMAYPAGQLFLTFSLPQS
jgi:hypothetical protein